MRNSRTLIFILTMLSAIAIISFISYYITQPPKIFETLVSIENSNGTQYGSGFFIDGEPGRCTVLTSINVIKNNSNKFKLRSQYKSQDKPFETSSIITFSDLEGKSPYFKSALIIFDIDLSNSKIENEVKSKCPYRSLKLSRISLDSNTEYEAKIWGYNHDKQRSLSPLSVKLSPEITANSTKWLIRSLSSSESQQIKEKVGGVIVDKNNKVIGINHAIENDNKNDKFDIFFIEDFLLNPQTYDYWIKEAEKSYEQNKLIYSLSKYNIATKIKPDDVKAWEGKAKILETKRQRESKLCEINSLNQSIECQELLTAWEKITEIQPKPQSESNDKLLEPWYKRCSLLNELQKWQETIIFCKAYKSFDSRIQKLYDKAIEEKNEMRIVEKQKEIEKLETEIENLKTENKNLATDNERYKNILSNYPFSLSSGQEVKYNGHLSSSNSESNAIFYAFYVANDPSYFEISLGNFKDINPQFTIVNENNQSFCQSSGSSTCRLSSGFYRIKVWNNTSDKYSDYVLKIYRRYSN